MTAEQFVKNIVHHDVILLNINGKKLKSERLDENTNIESHAVSQISIVEFEDEYVRVIVSTEVGFKPSMFFEFEFEHQVSLEFEDSITKELVEENREVILNLLGADISLLTGMLTDKMMNSPLIIPPSLEIKEN